MTAERLGDYYMCFAQKADYAGPFDEDGVPLLDYLGNVGIQYNPIAVAQYGLGNLSLYSSTGQQSRMGRCLGAADWLVRNLEVNSSGMHVWNHHFDWEYRTPLKAPWYSALAQGQGISLLVRTHQATKRPNYLEAATRAFDAFTASTGEGGVTTFDREENCWFEETIVDPPTHILNGFIWASWGVLDYHLHTGCPAAEQLFRSSVATMKRTLLDYDVGYWSLYEQSGTRMKMLASPFYHRLHIVQLRVMERLTGEPFFGLIADRWEEYQRSRWRRTRALGYKGVFKLIYY